jgi:hypothetical protein
MNQAALVCIYLDSDSLASAKWRMTRFPQLHAVRQMPNVLSAGCGVLFMGMHNSKITMN